MGQISQFLRRGEGFLSHYCPACRELHVVHVERPNELGCQWTWDGNIVAPTFSPSVDITAKRDGKIISCCHYTLIGGRLSFIDDCTHALKGLKVYLPALPFHLRDSNANL